MTSQGNDDTIGAANAHTILESPLGSELSETQASALSEKIAVFCLKDGDFLLEEGHKDDLLYVVIEGKLEVVKCVAGGDCVTLQLLHAGDMAGELGFVDGLTHTAGLRAIGNCVIFGLSRENLEGFLKTDPQVTYKVMRSIMRTVHGILRRMNMQYVEMQNYISKQHGRY